MDPIDSQNRGKEAQERPTGVHEHLAVAICHGLSPLAESATVMCIAVSLLVLCLSRGCLGLPQQHSGP